MQHKLAIIVSHPIQHFVHLYRELCNQPNIETHVFFASDIGIRDYYDKEMGTRIQWKADLLSGYSHTFLPGSAQIKSIGFRSINNPSLKKSLDSFSPTFVIIHGYAQINSLRAVKWCKSNSIPIAIWSDSNLHKDSTFFKKTIKFALLTTFFKYIDAFLTVGNNNERYYRNYGVADEQMYSVPFTVDENSLNNSRLRKIETKIAFNAHHQLDDDTFAVLFVGKLVSRKRPSDILTALHNILEERLSSRKIVAIFAGDGELKETIISKADQLSIKSILLGFVNVDQLPSVYASADVLIHPAENEPYGLALREATCVGLPIITTNKVGAVGKKDAARPNKNAIVYDCGDTNSLAASIALLCNNKSLYDNMSLQSLAISEEMNCMQSVRGIKNAIHKLSSGNIC